MRAGQDMNIIQNPSQLCFYAIIRRPQMSPGEASSALEKDTHTYDYFRTNHDIKKKRVITICLHHACVSQDHLNLARMTLACA